MSVLDGFETVTALLAVVCVLLTASVVVLAARVAHLTRMVGTTPPGSDSGALHLLGRDLREIARRVERTEHLLADLQRAGESSIRHVGIVRYDAFRDMGGHMSFSLALLDGRRNGVVVSVLNGRDGSRGYAKAVRGGRSSSPLSEEEQEALAQALDLAQVR